MFRHLKTAELFWKLNSLFCRKFHEKLGVSHKFQLKNDSSFTWLQKTTVETCNFGQWRWTRSPHKLLQRARGALIIHEFLKKRKRGIIEHQWLINEGINERINDHIKEQLNDHSMMHQWIRDVKKLIFHLHVSTNKLLDAETLVGVDVTSFAAILKQN